MRLVMVPLDGSALAEEALDYGARLARHCHARLCLLTVHADATMAEQAQSYLHSHLVRLQDEELKVMTLDCPGDPVEVILREILVQEVDLVVMSSHGRDGFARILEGSVAEEIVRRAACPTLLVRPTQQALGVTEEEERVLVLLDGSPESERALIPASTFGQENEVLLLHAVESAHADYFNVSPSTQDVARLARKAHAYLEKRACQLRTTCPRVRTLVAVGSPSREILLTLQREEARLLVMSDSGFEGPWGDHLCRMSPCPVLLVKRGLVPEKLERILIPMDGSAAAESALTEALRLPMRDVPKMATLLMASDLPPDPPAHLLDEQRSQVTLLRAYLEEQAAVLRSKGWTVDCQIVFGNPPARILGYLKENPHDLVVMTTHGRTGLSRWLIGSVAESVARQSPVCVLLAHSARKSTPG